MKAIKQAPGFSINDKNEIVNDKTKKVVAESNGSVRLKVDGNRKSFKVEELLSSNGVKPIVAKGWKKPNSPATGGKKEDSTKKKVVIKKPKAKKVEATEEKPAKKRIIKIAGVYLYKIKGDKEIEAAAKLYKAGDKVTYTDYKTKKKVTGTFVSHTKFSDGYPGARVSNGKGKEKKSKILSYLSLKLKK